MLRAQRLKVVTPSDVTWMRREGGQKGKDMSHEIRGGVEGELIPFRELEGAESYMWGQTAQHISDKLPI